MNKGKTIIYIRYTDMAGFCRRLEVSGFRYEEMKWWVEVGKLSYGSVGEIKCLHCMANNWTENGRTMNEYECGCCGGFIVVEPTC